MGITPWPGEGRKSNNIFKFMKVFNTELIDQLCSNINRVEEERNLLAIIAGGFYVELKEVLSSHNGY